MAAADMWNSCCDSAGGPVTALQNMAMLGLFSYVVDSMQMSAEARAKQTSKVCSQKCLGLGCSCHASRAVMTVSWYNCIAAMHRGLYQVRMPMVPEHASLPLRHDPNLKLLINHSDNSFFGIDSLLGFLR